MRDLAMGLILVLVVVAVHLVVVEGAPQYRLGLFVSFGVVFVICLLATGYLGEGWMPGYYAALMYLVLLLAAAWIPQIHRILDLGR